MTPTDNLCPTQVLHPGKPEISMAPLVDIVFLLLIFFMVTTVFPEENGLLIEKPNSENAAVLDNEQIIIDLDRQGIAYMEGKPVTIEDIKRLLKTELTSKPQLAVTIHVDRRATTESLVGVIDAAKFGGAQKVGIATNETPD